jgi:transcription initiation factor IIE alpha subunit
MDLRKLIVERIFFAFTDEELQEAFDINPNEVEDLSDIDLLELYEETVTFGSSGCDEI